ISSNWYIVSLDNCYIITLVHFQILKQQIPHFQPVVGTFVSFGVDIVRRGEQNFPSLKMLQIVTAIIDQNISIENMLAATEDSISPMYKRKMLIQPITFFP